jgi:hypothetical protein
VLRFYETSSGKSTLLCIGSVAPPELPSEALSVLDRIAGDQAAVRREPVQ